MKYLVTTYHISPREYSYVSTLIDGLLGTICLLIYMFKPVHMYDFDGHEIKMQRFHSDSWIMLLAGFLSGVAVLIGLIGVSIGKLGTTQVLLNSYSIVQILLEIVFKGAFPTRFQTVGMIMCLTGGALIVAYEDHINK